MISEPLKKYNSQKLHESRKKGIREVSIKYGVNHLILYHNPNDVSHLEKSELIDLPSEKSVEDNLRPATDRGDHEMSQSPASYDLKLTNSDTLPLTKNGYLRLDLPNRPTYFDGKPKYGYKKLSVTNHESRDGDKLSLDCGFRQDSECNFKCNYGKTFNNFFKPDYFPFRVPKRYFSMPATHTMEEDIGNAAEFQDDGADISRMYYKDFNNNNHHKGKPYIVGYPKKYQSNPLLMLEETREEIPDDSKISPRGRASRDETNGREVWSSKADFLLSIIGFAVDLSNIWRFPYLCYKNGGGAFLIPYTIMLIFGGLPLLYMELALGQYNRAGAVGIWKMVPFLKGTGYAAILITYYVSFYYPVIIGYAFYYLFASFTTKLPWSNCENAWNTPSCVEQRSQNMTNILIHKYNESNGSDYDHRYDMLHGTRRILKTASEEYFERKLLALQDGSGFHHLTPIKWDICLCSLLVYLVTFLSLFKGVKTSGKVVWFTAIAPYVLLTILLIQALLLPGSLNGIVYYLTPQMAKLKSAQVWYEAAVQIFYSTGPGFGVHVAYASYNKFHNNIQTDVLITCAVNSLTSFFAGFVVFAFLGYMSLQRGLEIDRVAKDGPGLVFIVYPEALSILKGSTFFSIIFFTTLLTLGMDSLLGGMEAVITGLLDDLEAKLKHIGISKKILIAIVIFSSFCGALLCTTKDGIYWVTFLDTYAAGTSLLFIVFFEAVGITWIYGIDRFSSNIEEMIGFKPNIFWRLCWKYISPSLIMGMIISGFILNEPLRYGDYIYPRWANYFGWGVLSSSVMLIPGYALWKFYKTDAKNIKQRLRLCLQSEEEPSEILANRETKQNLIGPPKK